MCPSVSEFIMRLGSVLQLCTKLEINLRIREFRKHIYYQVLISQRSKIGKMENSGLGVTRNSPQLICESGSKIYKERIFFSNYLYFSFNFNSISLITLSKSSCVIITTVMHRPILYLLAFRYSSLMVSGSELASIKGSAFSPSQKLTRKVSFWTPIQ